MEIITKYLSVDGQEFSTAVACLAHEDRYNDAKEANKLLLSGNDMVDVMIRANKSWTNWEKSLTEKDRSVLEYITKETEILIPEYSYDTFRVDHITTKGFVYLLSSRKTVVEDGSIVARPRGVTVELTRFIELFKKYYLD